MGARKGQNNFRDYQRVAADKRLAKVQRVLKALPRRTHYDDFDAVVRAVAQGAGVDPTTLKRNPRYRQAVWEHIRLNPGLITAPVSETAPRAELQVQAVSAQIEASALRRENLRLKRMVERQGISDVPDAREVLADAAGAATAANAAFERTATVLARLLNRLADKELGVMLDMARGEILDDAESGSRRIVAARPDTTPFLEWMRRQQSNGQLHRGEQN
ncbi:hypothetical protein [Methylobacterium brachiatum]